MSDAENQIPHLPESPHPAVIDPTPSSESGPGPVENRPPWGLWDVARIGALTIVMLVAANLAAFWIITRHATISPDELAKNSKVVLAAQAITYALVFLYMVILVRQRNRGFWSAVRWIWPPHSIAYPTIGIALSILVSSASLLLPIPKSLPIEQYFSDTTSAYLMAIFGITMAPLMEELIFRGFLYPVLAQKMPMTAAIALTSILFAGIHASQLAHAWAPLVLLFFVSVVLTTARAMTGSVAASFLIHLGYNSTLFFMMYLGTDHFRHLEKGI